MNSSLTLLFTGTFFFQNPQAQELQKKGRLVYGCIDTWLLWRLSNGKVCVTEPSNTSSTGMYDPFQVCPFTLVQTVAQNTTWPVTTLTVLLQGDYNLTILRLIGFPIKLLNPIVDTASARPLVQVQPRIFGRPVDVHCMVSFYPRLSQNFRYIPVSRPSSNPSCSAGRSAVCPVRSWRFSKRRREDQSRHGNLYRRVYGRTSSRQHER